MVGVLAIVTELPVVPLNLAHLLPSTVPQVTPLASDPWFEDPELSVADVPEA